jgi:hypothetical protein
VVIILAIMALWNDGLWTVVIILVIMTLWNDGLCLSAHTKWLSNRNDSHNRPIQGYEMSEPTHEVPFPWKTMF